MHPPPHVGGYLVGWKAVIVGTPRIAILLRSGIADPHFHELQALLPRSLFPDWVRLASAAGYGRMTTPALRHRAARGIVKA